MKNKIFFFLLPIFLGSLLVPLQAMPPKRVWKGKESEKAQAEEQVEKEQAAEDLEERGRALSDAHEEDSSSMLRGGEAGGVREDFDFSPAKFDESLAAIQQAQQECEKIIRETRLESLNEKSLREVSLQAEQQVQYWSKQKSRASSLLSERLERRKVSSVEEEQKLSNILVLCREVWMEWDDLFSKTQNEIEKREFGVTTDEDLDSDVASVSALEKPMASLKLTDPSTTPGGSMIGMSAASVGAASSSFVSNSLKGRLETFLATPHVPWPLVDSQLSSTQVHQQEIRNKMQTLLQRYKDEATLRDLFMKMLKREGEKFRRKIKEGWEDVVASHYSQAEQRYIQVRIPEVLQNYRTAITKGDEAVQIWSETEIFYTKLRDLSGEKVRHLGIKIKEGLKRRVRECQSKLDEIELNRGKNIEKVLQKLNWVQTEQHHVQAVLDEVEESVQNEVGTTCRVILGNLATMARHLTAAKNAFSQYDFRGGSEAERIVDEIQQETNCLNRALKGILEAWRGWRDRKIEPECLEEDSSHGKSIWKMRFMGPLIRKEIIAASATEEVHELEMAAEHLMVVLIPYETMENFCAALTVSGYPECRLEAVSREDALYRLFFKPNKTFQYPLLQTFDELKKTIQDNHLALRCYPDYMMEIDSANAAAANAVLQAAVAPPVQEPWAFHHEKGLHPPDRLFDLGNPLLQAPPSPIKVAIIDSGIFGSITTGGFETHKALTGKIAYTFDEQRQQATGFGYNALFDRNMELYHNDDDRKLAERLKFQPEDTNGHGTHVAGIIAASHGVVPDVAGLAGMPGFAELIICKWVQPGSTKGFYSDAIKCIKYAEQQGVQIINCSWGRRLYGPKNLTGVTPEEIQDLENAIRDKPFIVVASSGNRLSSIQPPEDVDKINRYPCNFVLSNLISVAGIGRQGKVPNNFSNFGSKSIHLAAPGKDIVSTWIGEPDATESKTGSSQAAPYVTAALVLTKIKFSSLNKALVQYLRYACNVKPNNEMQVKHGPLNLTNVLSDQTMQAFLKSIGKSDQKDETLFNLKKGKKKK